MHFNILTLNTALVFTLIDDTQIFNAIQLRKKGLAIGNILKHNSFALTDGLFIKLK